MKNSKIIIAGVAVVALIATAVVMLYFNNKTDEPSPEGNPSAVGTPAVIVVRTDSGYEPKEITVKKGDIVLWRNETDEYHWPASDLHPTHAIYSAFDPKMPIAPGDEWAFEFDQVGTWKYHDHIRANKTGTVVVTE